MNKMKRKVPIVAVTAYEDEETMKKCHKIGISAVITKPVNSDLLLKIVTKFYG
jgi:AmiR/NasT family two-component response regulator